MWFLRLVHSIRVDSFFVATQRTESVLEGCGQNVKIIIRKESPLVFRK